MRRGRRKAGGDDAEVDMTPMLDIVFIMLIPTKSTPAITVYVDARDQCSVDGEGTTCDRVSLRVERLLADKPGASVILRLDEGARHELLVGLKDELDTKGLGSKIEILRATGS